MSLPLSPSSTDHRTKLSALYWAITLALMPTTALISTQALRRFASQAGYINYTEIFNPQENKDRHGDYLDPEEGINYEIGFKSTFFDGLLNTV